MKLSISNWLSALALRDAKAKQARERSKAIHEAQLHKSSYTYSREKVRK
jgi:hypothetical protein